MKVTRDGTAYVSDSLPIALKKSIRDAIKIHRRLMRCAVPQPELVEALKPFRDALGMKAMEFKKEVFNDETLDSR